jgi:signal transduction histidine kinase
MGARVARSASSTTVRGPGAPARWRRSSSWAGAIAALLELRALLAQAARDQEIGRPEAELLSSISHDLQQPLTVVKGQAQLLQRSIRDGLALPADAVMASLAHIVAAADRMTGQLMELLDLSTPRLGRPVGAVRRPADLVDIARQAVGDHQRGAEATSLALATTEAMLVAFVDAERLRRVLDNVFGNAIKYSPSGGAVLVSLEREKGTGGSYAVLRVRDQGIGIPAADLPRVTERFYRGANVAGIVAGTGIGLADARRTVHEHGGSLTMESTEGHGTTVTLRLPLVPFVDAPTTTDQPSAGREWAAGQTGAIRRRSG